MRKSRHWLWLLFLPLVGLGLVRLDLETDILDLLPQQLPSVAGLKIYEKNFSNARELIITVQDAEPETAQEIARTLAGGLRQHTNLIASVAWQPPWLEKGEEMGEILALMRLNETPEKFGELTNRLAPQHLQAVLAETRDALATSLSPVDIARLAFDPYGLVSVPSEGFGGFSMDNTEAMFAGRGGQFRVLYVQSAVELTNYKACTKWLEQVKQAVGNCRRPEWKKAVIRYTGRPAFVAEISGSMERDIRNSVIGTSIIIGLLFWFAHRRMLPVIWLLVLLGLVLVGTLGLAGLLLGKLNIISLGAAAIILGLAVDYAVVHYQEALAHPHASVPEIRRAIAPSILWAAVTTICAFLVLNFGGLPGLAQLGTLVAIGMSLAALVMVAAYLPPLFPDRLNKGHLKTEPKLTGVDPGLPKNSGAGWMPIFVTGVVFVLASAVVLVKQPGVDRAGEALRPKCEADQALREMQTALGVPEDPLWVVISGRCESDVYRRLTNVEAFLSKAAADGTIKGHLLPTMLWPRVECQQSNRAAAGWLADRADLLRTTALKDGFSEDALLLTRTMTDTFARLNSSSGVTWPTNRTSRWLLNKFVSRTTNGWLVLGLIYPNSDPAKLVDAISNNSAFDEDVRVSGWQLLGAETLNTVQERFWIVITPMVLLVMASLWFAFRRWREVLFGVGVLFLSGLCLMAVMAVAGWSWNLFSMLALPLVLGTGVDYSIFMQLALRRHSGDVGIVKRSVGRALLLCGGTAIAGFGSLAWWGDAGMASLGQVCAVGIAANMSIAVFLIPAWWCKTNSPRKEGV